MKNKTTSQTETPRPVRCSAWLGHWQTFRMSDIASRFHCEDNDKSLKFVEIQSLAAAYGIKNPTNVILKPESSIGKKNLKLAGGGMCSRSGGISQVNKFFRHAFNSLYNLLFSFGIVAHKGDDVKWPNSKLSDAKADDVKLEPERNPRVRSSDVLGDGK